jgi:hypothetical protein
MTRAVGGLAVALAALLLLCVWLGIRDGGQGVPALGGGQLVPAVSYRLVDEDTIEIIGLTGEGAWSRITNVVESSTEVRVAIRVLYWPGSYTAQGVRTEWTVHLAAPLGNRIVSDGFQNLPSE